MSHLNPSSNEKFSNHLMQRWPQLVFFPRRGRFVVHGTSWWNTNQLGSSSRTNYPQPGEKGRHSARIECIRNCAEEVRKNLSSCDGPVDSDRHFSTPRVARQTIAIDSSILPGGTFLHIIKLWFMLQYFRNQKIAIEMIYKNSWNIRGYQKVSLFRRQFLHFN